MRHSTTYMTTKRQNTYLFIQKLRDKSKHDWTKPSERENFKENKGDQDLGVPLWLLIFFSKVNIMKISTYFQQSNIFHLIQLAWFLYDYQWSIDYTSILTAFKHAQCYGTNFTTALIHAWERFSDIHMFNSVFHYHCLIYISFFHFSFLVLSSWMSNNFSNKI